MALTAMLYVENDAGERRGSPRRGVGAETTVRRSGAPVRAILHDLSTTGASIEAAVPLAPGSTVTIGLSGVGRFAATVVTLAGTRAGCRFNEPLSFDAIQTAFASDPVVAARFGDDSAAVIREGTDEKYPGPFRVALAVVGAIGGWVLIFHAVRAAFS